MKIPKQKKYWIINETEVYLVRIIKTGEIIERFRTKAAALTNLSRIEEEVFEKLEIIKNENL